MMTKGLLRDAKGTAINHDHQQWIKYYYSRRPAQSYKVFPCQPENTTASTPHSKIGLSSPSIRHLPCSIKPKVLVH